MLEWETVDADYYIWLDWPILIESRNFINKMIDNLDSADICLFNHQASTCESPKNEKDWILWVLDKKSGNWDYSKGFQEGCYPPIKPVDGYKIYNKYKDEPLEEQYNFYCKDPRFLNNKSFSTGCFIYSKNLVKNRDYNLMTDWYYHCARWSINDQISLPYLIDKHEVRYNVFQEGDVYTNPYYTFDNEKTLDT